MSTVLAQSWVVFCQGRDDVLIASWLPAVNTHTQTGEKSTSAVGATLPLRPGAAAPSQ